MKNKILVTLMFAFITAVSTWLCYTGLKYLTEREPAAAVTKQSEVVDIFILKSCYTGNQWVVVNSTDKFNIWHISIVEKNPILRNLLDDRRARTLSEPGLKCNFANL